jgi:hypothetical protein
MSKIDRGLEWLCSSHYKMETIIHQVLNSANNNLHNMQTKDWNSCVTLSAARKGSAGLEKRNARGGVRRVGKNKEQTGELMTEWSHWGVHEAQAWAKHGKEAGGLQKLQDPSQWSQFEKSSPPATTDMCACAMRRKIECEQPGNSLLLYQLCSWLPLSRATAISCLASYMH